MFRVILEDLLNKTKVNKNSINKIHLFNNNKRQIFHHESNKNYNKLYRIKQ